MARLERVSPETATGKTKELYSLIKANLGVVPNMMQTMGNSSAFLEGYLKLNGALGSGKLGAKVGELIALIVAEINGCNYCLSAHTYLGANLAKLDQVTMDAARSAVSADRKTDAILKFAKAVVLRKGKVTDGEIATAKEAGISEGEIAEIIGHVGLNILTNYFNTAADTEIDFPVVRAEPVAVI